MRSRYLGLALLASLFVPVQLWAQLDAGICATDDPYESNNSLSTAATISVPIVASNLVCCDDDWFTFTVPEYFGAQIAITFSGAQADLDLQVRDSNGIIGSSTSSGDREEYTSAIFATSTTLWIKVYRFGPRTAAYTLTIDLYEVTNDTCASATAIAPVSVVRGSTIGAKNDYDFLTGSSSCAGSDMFGVDVAYTVNIEAGQYLTVILSSQVNLGLYLLDDCQTRCCWAGVDAQPGRVNETLTYPNITGAAQRLFLIVDSADAVSGGFYLTVDTSTSGPDAGSADAGVDTAACRLDPSPCGSLTDIGECVGDLFRYCSRGRDIFTIDCTSPSQGYSNADTCGLLDCTTPVQCAGFGCVARRGEPCGRLTCDVATGQGCIGGVCTTSTGCNPALFVRSCDAAILEYCHYMVDERDCSAGGTQPYICGSNSENISDCLGVEGAFCGVTPGYQCAPGFACNFMECNYVGFPDAGQVDAATGDAESIDARIVDAGETSDGAVRSDASIIDAAIPIDAVWPDTIPVSDAAAGQDVPVAADAVDFSDGGRLDRVDIDGGSLPDVEIVDAFHLPDIPRAPDRQLADTPPAIDAGSALDSSTPADAVSGSDASRSDDAAELADARTLESGQGTGEQPSCHCGTATDSSAGVLVVSLLLAATGWRRRRCRATL